MKDPPIFFDVMLHLGTLLAIVVYFWRDILEIVHGMGTALRGKRKNSQGVKLLFWIIFATIPTGLIGFFCKHWFETFFSRPRIVGVMLLITGTVLWLTRWSKRDGKKITGMGWLDSLLIGIAQGMAIIPGISRSGATISTGLFCGLEREFSAKFSFLLSIPAILGATLLEFKKVDVIQGFWTIFIGTGVAFGVGILSLIFLIRINRIENISNFSYYCWIIGLVITILI
jgi:undecaprenyl-diphosphatase